MKMKKGFTLAEVLIAVGIIGIIAALMAHAFNSATPDRTKMLFLKAYDGLSEAVIAMEEDTTLFGKRIQISDGGSGQDIDISNHPFLDDSQPSNPYFNSNYYSGNLKFAKILAVALKGDSPEEKEGSLTFTSGPGKYTWKITPQSDLENLALNTTTDPPFLSGFANEIELTINDNENDKFTMCVQANGEITILDEIQNSQNRGLTHLNNRRNVKRDEIQQIVSGLDTCSVSDIQVQLRGNTYITIP